MFRRFLTNPNDGRGGVRDHQNAENQQNITKHLPQMSHRRPPRVILIQNVTVPRYPNIVLIMDENDSPPQKKKTKQKKQKTKGVQCVQS